MADAPTTDPMVLRLELDRETEPISGRLSADAGPAVRFTGWVGLAAAIEALIAPEPLEN